MFESANGQPQKTDIQTLTPQSPDSANSPFEDTAEKMGWLHNPWVRRVGAAVAGVALVAAGWRIGTANGDRQPAVDTAPNQPPASAAPQTPGPETPTSASPEALTGLGFPTYADPELEVWGLDRGTNRGEDGQWLYTPDTYMYRVANQELTREDMIKRYTLDTERYPTREDAAKAFVAMMNDYVRAGNSTAAIEEGQRFNKTSLEAFHVTSRDGRRGGSDLSGRPWPVQREMLVATTTGAGKDGLFEAVPGGIRDTTDAIMYDQALLENQKVGEPSLEYALNRINYLELLTNLPGRFKNNPEDIGMYEPTFTFDRMSEDPSDPEVVTIVLTFTDNFGDPGVVPEGIIGENYVDSSQRWTIKTRLGKNAEGTAWQLTGKTVPSFEEMPQHSK